MEGEIKLSSLFQKFKKSFSQEIRSVRISLKRFFAIEE